MGGASPRDAAAGESVSLQAEDIARLALRQASLKSRFSIHPCYEDTMAKKAKKAKKAAKKTKKKSKKK